MMLSFKIVGLLVSFCFLISFKTVETHFEKNPSLLIVSFDGFRWNYLSRATLPNIDKIISHGVHATEGVMNVFDTSTLPNHWTLVTGLYPESHGVISNYLRDPTIEKDFVPKYVDATYQNDPRYYDDGGEPIWATNQFQGGRSGSVMWWGSENTVKWSRPTFQQRYDDTVTFTERIDIMMGWLTQEKPVNLGLVYIPEPDHIGHKAGPESSNVTEQIKETDNIVGYLVDKLEKNDLLDDLNIIITSDHGMTTTSKDMLIFLDEFISIDDYDILSNDTVVASIFPHEGKLSTVYDSLKRASEQEGSHFKVFYQKDIPERFHMKNNLRVPPIIAIADIHYRLVANKSPEDDFPLAGTHGYDNEEKDMRPFFIAMGPSFKKGHTVKTFNSVDIYPLMCHLLGIKPAPNNGSLDIVGQLLQGDEEHEEGTTIFTFGTYFLTLIVVTGVGGVFAVAACRQHRIFKHRRVQLKLATFGSKMRMSPEPTNDARAYMIADSHSEDEDEEEAAGDGISSDYGRGV